VLGWLLVVVGIIQSIRWIIGGLDGSPIIAFILPGLLFLYAVKDAVVLERKNKTHFGAIVWGWIIFTIGNTLILLNPQTVYGKPSPDGSHGAWNGCYKELTLIGKPYYKSSLRVVDGRKRLIQDRELKTTNYISWSMNWSDDGKTVIFTPDDTQACAQVTLQVGLGGSQ